MIQLLTAPLAETFAHILVMILAIRTVFHPRGTRVRRGSSASRNNGVARYARLQNGALVMYSQHDENALLLCDDSGKTINALNITRMRSFELYPYIYLKTRQIYDPLVIYASRDQFEWQ